ncbi:1377_t:CDS:2, partial [Gigaspora margarita]
QRVKMEEQPSIRPTTSAEILRTWAEEAEVIRYVEFVLSKDINLIEAKLDPNYDDLEDDSNTDAEL